MDSTPVCAKRHICTILSGMICFAKETNWYGLAVLSYLLTYVTQQREMRGKQTKEVCHPERSEGSVRRRISYVFSPMISTHSWLILRYAQDDTLPWFSYPNTLPDA